MRKRAATYTYGSIHNALNGIAKQTKSCRRKKVNTDDSPPSPSDSKTVQRDYLAECGSRTCVCRNDRTSDAAASGRTKTNQHPECRERVVSERYRRITTSGTLARSALRRFERGANAVRSIAVSTSGLLSSNGRCCRLSSPHENATNVSTWQPSVKTVSKRFFWSAKIRHSIAEDEQDEAENPSGSLNPINPQVPGPVQQRDPLGGRYPR